jgi:hypothetical protein
MKKLVVVLVAMSFVLSVFGLLFAQTPSSTAQEKASDNATFNRGDAKPTAKPNVDKMKAKQEKAAKEKATQEKATQDKSAQTKGKAGKAKTGPHVEEVKKPVVFRSRLIKPGGQGKAIGLY